MAFPEFIAPMLAQSGKPFDSDRHLFEIKWDGYRCLVRVDQDGYTLTSRNKLEFTHRFIELDFCASLPPGTILDAEIVILDDRGLPDFQALQRKFAGGDRHASARKTITSLVAFDVLYHNYESTMHESLVERRERLYELVQRVDHPRFLFSETIEGSGVEFFKQAAEQGFEGIIAKRKDSRYLPGKRAAAWQKIKRGQQLFCVIIGFVPAEDSSRDFRSVAVATDQDGKLTYIGNVGSGIGQMEREEMNDWLWQARIDAPVVPCPGNIFAVRPERYCRVSFLEFTDEGILRAPVFEEWLVENDR